MAPSNSRTQNTFTDIPPVSRIDGSKKQIGLLSQTLSPSPVVRWILPARIRSHLYRDIVFVGTTYVQLREFLPNRQLKDATAKLHLRSQILGAKVISCDVEKVPYYDAALEKEIDVEKFSIKGKPCTDKQPPQIVVLSTADSGLVFMYAKENARDNAVGFVWAKRMLLEGYFRGPKFNRHIAMHEDSKVMAVASDDSFSVLRLKAVDDLKDSIDLCDPRDPESFQPFYEQRLIQVDGFILKMDFLRPPENEPDKAILLLIVACAGETLLLLYKWDIKESLTYITPMIASGQVLQSEDTFPLLLIPSSRRASFVIVTETDFVFYDNIHTRTARRLAIPFPSDESTSSGQLWVQWAKPTRHEEYGSQKEDILLVREDGVLRVFTRTYNPPSRTTSNFTPGKLHIGVDSAVCMLPGQPGDIMIVGGAMTDGRVFHLAPREEIFSLQVLSNVSPVHDMAMVDCATNRRRDVRSRRLFVTAGMPGVSSLNELSYGLEAQVCIAIPYIDGLSINRMWALEHGPTKTLCILTSYPEYTTAFALDFQTQAYDVMGPGRYPGLHLEAETLAADILSSGVCVQITAEYICAGFDKPSPRMQSIGRCLCADIEVRAGYLVIACSESGAYQIRIGRIDGSKSQPEIIMSSLPFQCDERPLCLQLIEVGGSLHLVVGYSGGNIEFFSIDHDARIFRKSRLPLTDSDVGAVTSLVVLNHTISSETLVLAGTRDGKLKVIKMIWSHQSDSAEFDLVLDKIFQIGLTAVSVVAARPKNVNDAKEALVKCGHRLDRLTYFNNDAKTDYILSSIWLTIRSDLSYTSPDLMAVQTIPYLRSRKDSALSGLLMCATKDEILFASLIPQEQMVPRRLDLKNYGARLMVFSKTLNKFVVASDTTMEGLSNQQAGSGRRCATLHIVDPDYTRNDYQPATKIILSERNEQVKALLTWEPTDGRSHYDLIMIGLSDGTNSRLGFVAVKKLASSMSNVVFKSLMKFSNKCLHALCAVEKSSLVVSVGKEIVMMRLDIASKKWHEEARYLLPSPALSISAQGSVIYAATASHSTLVLKWERATKRFEKVITDRVARNARFVLPFGRQGDHLLVTTASGQGTSLIAYSMDGGNTMNIPTPLFDAEIPACLNHVVSIPSTWSANHQQAFQGISFDGTVFVFKILTYEEMKLLEFIEDLIQPEPVSSARKQLSTAASRVNRRLTRGMRVENTVTVLDPKKMHVHGDVLKQVIDQGPEALWKLLGAHNKKPKIKNEDEMMIDHDDDKVEDLTKLTKLEALAKPMVGTSTDVPAAVVAWMRTLLRSTVF